MPQIRAVMSGTSVKRVRAGTPRRSAAARRFELHLLDLAVAHAHVHRALALHAREHLGEDLRSAMLPLAFGAELRRAGVEGAIQAHDVALVQRVTRRSQPPSEAVLGDSIGPKQP